MEIESLIWSFLAAVVSTSLFFLIKFFIKNKSLYILFFIILLELLGIYLHHKSLQKLSSGLIFSIISAFSVLLGVFIAVYFFGEKFKKIDIIGFIFIAIGIIILDQKRAAVKY